jgi:hypothetical protein
VLRHFLSVRLVTLLVCAAALSAGLVAGSARAALRTHGNFTTYAVPVRAQFMNHADDRIRGMSANPFTPNQQALVIVANGTEKKNGPFPGDDILYTFKLYPSAKLDKSNGTALFTCYYTFVKRATCDAYFQTKNGILVGNGRIVFGAKDFTLALSGGTDSYLGAHGEVAAKPAPGKEKLAEKLAFELVGA